MRLGIAVLAATVGMLLAAPLAHGFIYWSAYDSGNSKIGRASLDAAAVDPALVTGIYFGQGVATDGEHVFWGESGSNPKFAYIGRANADGSEPNHAFQYGATYCGIFDIVTSATDLFWLKSDCSGLEFGWDIDRTAKSGGGGAYTEVGAGNSTVCGFDVNASYVYWSEGHYIARAPLPGPSPAERKWLDVGAGISPCAIAVDGGHVYWTTVQGAPTYRGANIGRASIDGNPASVQSAFISGASFTNASGLDVAGDFIYWSNAPGIGELTGSIGRANLDGTGVSHFFISQLFNPGSIDVDAAGPQPAPPGSPGQGPPPASPNVPRIVFVSTTNRSFGPGAGSTPARLASFSKALPKGTVFTYKLDGAATVKIEMKRLKAGRLVGNKCKARSKANAKKKKCDLTEHRLTRGGTAGTNRVPYTGKVKGKILKPGKYRAFFTATTAAGSGKPASVAFTFVRPPKK